jgi:hypothetical protein
VDALGVGSHLRDHRSHDLTPQERRAVPLRGVGEVGRDVPDLAQVEPRVEVHLAGDRLDLVGRRLVVLAAEEEPPLEARIAEDLRLGRAVRGRDD